MKRPDVERWTFDVRFQNFALPLAIFPCSLIVNSRLHGAPRICV
jgi:hypothetical protein